jgi:hypothetical protein
MDGFLMEWQLFEPGTIPEYTTPEWYAGRERAPHLEQEPHKWRLETAARFITELVVPHSTAVVDLGAGDGGLLSLVRKSTPGAACWGYDLQRTNVRAATQERAVTVIKKDVVTDFDHVTWGGLSLSRRIAVCTEMLEHLVDPHGFLKRVAEQAHYVVASSPVTETDRDHYEFHTWAWDFEGYEELLTGAGFAVLKHERWGMFQVIAGAR